MVYLDLKKISFFNGVKGKALPQIQAPSYRSYSIDLYNEINLFGVDRM
jgi:hypothetical protein